MNTLLALFCFYQTPFQSSLILRVSNNSSHGFQLSGGSAVKESLRAPEGSPKSSFGHAAITSYANRLNKTDPLRSDIRFETMANLVRSFPFSARPVSKNIHRLNPLFERSLWRASLRLDGRHRPGETGAMFVSIFVICPSQSPFTIAQYAFLTRFFSKSSAAMFHLAFRANITKPLVSRSVDGGGEPYVEHRKPPNRSKTSL